MTFDSFVLTMFYVLFKLLTEIFFVNNISFADYSVKIPFHSINSDDASFFNTNIERLSTRHLHVLYLYGLKGGL